MSSEAPIMCQAGVVETDCIWPHEDPCLGNTTKWTMQPCGDDAPPPPVTDAPYPIGNTPTFETTTTIVAVGLPPVPTTATYTEQPQPAMLPETGVDATGGLAIGAAALVAVGVALLRVSLR